jgi:diguanylate cyclase (GGDEF)-like protein/PAS domain S-box-containing protein
MMLETIILVCASQCDGKPEAYVLTSRPSVSDGSYSRAMDALAAVETISDGVITVDLGSRITFMNKAAERMTGWNRNDSLGQPVIEVFKVVNAATRVVNWNSLQAAMDDNEQYGLLPDSVLISRTGTEIPVEDATTPMHDDQGQVCGATIVFRNMSYSGIMLLRAMHRAQHDPLTNLPNRTLLEDRITQALSSMQHRPHRIAVLFVDLDRFKSVNDVLGHAVGDNVLRMIAKRMTIAVRGSDTVCRLGGDEFVLLLPEVLGTDDVQLIGEKILAAVRVPIVLETNTLRVTASIGIVLEQDSYATAHELLRDADSAMYHAKSAGGDKVRFFQKEIDVRKPKHHSLEQAISQALEQEEFALYYQPQVSLTTGKVIGAEALLRWPQPRGGVLLPESFIAVAERSELIVPLGQWVLREAVKQQRSWHEQGYPELIISANVSAVELQHKDYLVELDRIVDSVGVNPEKLLLELTESVLLSQTEQETPVLSGLRQRGLRLGIDDFGTGYSSLSYLRRFPVDIIKIDRSFITDCTTSVQDAALVRAIIGMSRSLNKTVIAEGVETLAQIEFLKSLGCDQAQGFYFGPPVPADMFQLSSGRT